MLSLRVDKSGGQRASGLSADEERNVVGEIH